MRTFDDCLEWNTGDALGYLFYPPLMAIWKALPPRRSVNFWNSVDGLTIFSEHSLGEAREVP